MRRAPMHDLDRSLVRSAAQARALLAEISRESSHRQDVPGCLNLGDAFTKAANLIDRVCYLSREASPRHRARFDRLACDKLLARQARVLAKAERACTHVVRNAGPQHG